MAQVHAPLHHGGIVSARSHKPATRHLLMTFSRGLDGRPRNRRLPAITAGGGCVQVLAAAAPERGSMSTSRHGAVWVSMTIVVTIAGTAMLTVRWTQSESQGRGRPNPTPDYRHAMLREGQSALVAASPAPSISGCRIRAAAFWAFTLSRRDSRVSVSAKNPWRPLRADAGAESAPTDTIHPWWGRPLAPHHNVPT